MQHWEEIADAEQKAHDIGYTEGELSFLVQLVCCKLTKNLSSEEIADQLEIDLSKIQNICSTAKPYAPNYDVEKLTQELLNKD